MARKDHWMMAISKEVKQRMQDALPDIVAGIKDTVPYGQPPPEPAPPDLTAFLQASPDERQAFWAGTPPEDYAKTQDHFMNEAVHRYGSMASVLQPLFVDGQISSLIQHGQFGQATGADATMGVAAASSDLASMLGIDPFKP